MLSKRLYTHVACDENTIITAGALVEILYETLNRVRNYEAFSVKDLVYHTLDTYYNKDKHSDAPE